jgi:hypothetical protein
LSDLGEQDRRELLAWVGEHLPRARRSVYGQHFLYWSMGIALVVGLAANVGGYLLKSSVTTEPLGLVADLLYELGYALWTGVVVVVFVQIIPEAKTAAVQATRAPLWVNSSLKASPHFSITRRDAALSARAVLIIRSRPTTSNPYPSAAWAPSVASP